MNFNYFNGKISRGFVSIYSARMILRITGGLLGIFVPVFLYQLFNFDFRYVVGWYGLGYLVYGLTVAWGAQYLNKIGLRRSIRISIVLGALYYFFFYLMDREAQQVEWVLGLSKLNIFLVGALVSVWLQRITYWIPLHTDLAKFTNKSNRGKELAVMQATILILGAIMPVISGWVLSQYNYDILFLIAVFIYFMALFPLMMLPRTKEKFSWGYFETWKKLFSKKRRKTVLAFAGDGAENVVALVIWPIFIWELLDGDFFQVGVLSSVIVFVAAGMQLIVGKFVDCNNKNKMLKWGSFLYAVGWIVKIFIVTAFQIFVVSTYHNLAKIFARTPFDALTYEKAADQGHYVDEYTVLHEMAMNFGKVIMVIFAVILVNFVSIECVFVLAALASLALNLLAEDKVIAEGRHH